MSLVNPVVGMLESSKFLRGLQVLAMGLRLRVLALEGSIPRNITIVRLVFVYMVGCMENDIDGGPRCPCHVQRR